MKLSNRIIAFVSCVVCFAMLMSGITGSAMAAETIKLDQPCQLWIDYQYEGQSVPGAQFHVYRIADLSHDGVMTLTGAFAEYPVELNDLTSEEFQAAAETLYGYALLDDVEPDYILTTDENGKAGLRDLTVGVYLVVGQDVAVENGELVCDPMLVCLPTMITEDEGNNYVLTIKPKCDFDEDEEEKKPRKIKVLKRWIDGGCEERPASVTVYLLRNGVIYDTVVLSDANNWRHTWTDLDPDAHWMVVEQIPEDYFVLVQRYGVTYLIINFRECEEETTQPSEPSEPTEPPTEPSEPSEPSEPTEPSEPSEPSEPTEPSEPSEPSESTEPSEPSEPTEPSEPSETTEPEEPTEPDGPQIPDTGVLWWPVPLLALGGVALILTGTVIRRRESEDA